MSVFDWSTTAANNATADSNINWAEGQAPSTVNDSSRAEMARMAHFFNWCAANVTSGGSSNAYTYTSGESLSAYSDNMRFAWSPNADSTGAVTINVDTIGAKKVYMPDGTQAGNGDLDADSLYDIVYDSSLDSSNGAFKIVGFPDTTLTAADYLTVANNLSDLNNASTARSNLGLGTMAVETASNYPTLAGANAFTGSNTFTDTDAIPVNINHTNAFSASDVSDEQKGGIHVTITNSNAGSGNLGPGLSFGGANGTGRRRAGMAAKQVTADADQTGLAFFVYTSTASSSDAVVEAGFFDHNTDLNVTNDVNAVDFNASSDLRLKNEIEDLPYGLREVLKLRPVRHGWRDENKPEKALGFIAQELELLVPELVNENTDGLKSISYGKGFALLVKAIQELTEEVRNGRS